MHYSVAVFTDGESGTVVDLLAPYDENIEVERYVAHTKQELIDAGRKEIEQYRDSKYKTYLENPEKYLMERCHGNPDSNHFRYISEEFPKRLLWTDEEIYQHEVLDYSYSDIGEDGEVYSTYNPDSKWDWYSFGGRFSGELLLKNAEDEDECWADSALAVDVDFDGMKRAAYEQLTPYDQFINDTSWYSKEYLQRMYPDKDAYERQMTAFSTYAVVTPDGQWHAPGEMGWFSSSESPEESQDWNLSYYQRFIQPAIDNGWEITIVDCHI